MVDQNLEAPTSQPMLQSQFNMHIEEINQNAPKDPVDEMRGLMFKTDQRHVYAIEELDKLLFEVRSTPNDSVYTPCIKRN